MYLQQCLAAGKNTRGLYYNNFLIALLLFQCLAFEIQKPGGGEHGEEQ